MRLLMMGTGPFAVPTFETLCRSPHEVLALVSRPPRGRRASKSKGASKPKGTTGSKGKSRGNAPVSPMCEAAAALGVEVWTPESANLAESQSRIREYQADLLVVCDYGEILKSETLGAARLGGINLHASLLPKYRGAAPINWAMFDGEKETGISVIQMTAGLDAGPCLSQVATEITPTETAVELEDRLAILGAEAVCQTIDDLENDCAKPIIQDQALATKAPRLKKTDGLVDWTRDAGQIVNQFRALQPWPGCYTYLQRAADREAGREPMRLILGEISVWNSEDSAQSGDDSTTLGETGAAGRALDTDKRLIVETGGGAVEIHKLQPAGKRMLAAEEFLRGTPIRPGDLFLSAETRE